MGASSGGRRNRSEWGITPELSSVWELVTRFIGNSGGEVQGEGRANIA